MNKTIIRLIMVTKVRIILPFKMLALGVSKFDLIIRCGAIKANNEHVIDAQINAIEEISKTKCVDKSSIILMAQTDPITLLPNPKTYQSRRNTLRRGDKKRAVKKIVPDSRTIKNRNASYIKATS
jgi:hypothetical protein